MLIFLIFIISAPWLHACPTSLWRLRGAAAIKSINLLCRDICASNLDGKNSWQHWRTLWFEETALEWELLNQFPQFDYPLCFMSFKTSVTYTILWAYLTENDGLPIPPYRYMWGWSCTIPTQCKTKIKPLVNTWEAKHRATGITFAWHVRLLEA